MTQTRDTWKQTSLARKKQDNEIFDAKMKKKDRERYWKAYDCRPPRKRDIGVEWPKAIPASVLKILVKNNRIKMENENE